MRPLLLTLLLAAPPALAQSDPPRAPAPEATAEAGAAVAAVIGDQLAAFNARDVERAWSHASPLIRSVFGSSANFGRMVESGYPMVWTNRDPSYDDPVPFPGGLIQVVRMTDEDGLRWALEYQMVPDGEGWKINGVRILESPDMTA